MPRLTRKGKSDKETRRSSFVDAFNQQTYEGNSSFHSESGKPSDDDFDDDMDDTSRHLAHMDSTRAAAYAHGAAANSSQSSAAAAAEPVEIAREHAKALRTWRILVGVALVTVSAGVLISMPLLWRRQQDEASLRNVRACVCVCFLHSLPRRHSLLQSLENPILWESCSGLTRVFPFLLVFLQYALVSQSIQDTLEERMIQFRRSLTSLSWTVTTTQTADQAFPLVTVPQFELAASAVRATVATATMWNPLIRTSHAAEWSDYVRTHQDWYLQSQTMYKAGVLHATANQDRHRSLAQVNVSLFRDEIWQLENSVNQISAVATAGPIWQCSPPPQTPSNVINYNVLSDPAVATTLWPSLRRAVDGVVGNVLLEQHAVWDSVWNVSSQQDELYSLHLEPVLSAVNNPKSEMVGFLTSLLSWTRVLSHLVSSDVEGIVAVLQSSCLESHTFVLQGPQVRPATRTSRGTGRRLQQSLTLYA
jgi:hypothetical protein